MANSPQARKRARQNETRRQRNMALRTKFRTFLKNVYKAIAGGDKSQASDAFKQAEPVIDGMVSKGIIHKNKAARHKSRLSSQIKSMS